MRNLTSCDIESTLSFPQKEAHFGSEPTERSSVRERTSRKRSLVWSWQKLSVEHPSVSQFQRSKRSSNGERTWHGRSEKGTNLAKEAQIEQIQPKSAAKKYEKSMKAATKPAGRSEQASELPIFFRISQKRLLRRTNWTKAAHFGVVSVADLEAFRMKEARFAPVWLQGGRLGCCSVSDGTLLERNATVSRTACFRLLSAANLLKENELVELGDFGERPNAIDVIELGNELVHHPVSHYRNGERRKTEILYQKQKTKNRFCFRKSAFCFSPLYGKVTI